jgi:hypothetical protein
MKTNSEIFDNVKVEAIVAQLLANAAGVRMGRFPCPLNCMKAGWSRCLFPELNVQGTWIMMMAKNQ